MQKSKNVSVSKHSFRETKYGKREGLECSAEINGYGVAKALWIPWQTCLFHVFTVFYKDKN